MHHNQGAFEHNHKVLNSHQGNVENQKHLECKNINETHLQINKMSEVHQEIRMDEN